MSDLPTERPAPADHPIADVLRRRWSSRTFDGSALGDAELLTLFEAARWAPSSGNEQPWRFVLAPRTDPEAFAAALACLRPGNRGWAAGASLLLFACAERTFRRSGGENRFAWHDVGLAVANLTVQAAQLSLHVHVMGGIERDAVRERYRIPDGVDVVSGVAVGRLGDGAELTEEQRERERRPRVRRPLSEQVFEGVFGRPARAVAEAEAP